MLVFFRERAAGAEQLDRAGDRAERVADLVGEAPSQAGDLFSDGARRLVLRLCDRGNECATVRV